MKMYQIDAFTQQLFKGNPAAVIVLNYWLEDAVMQQIALENNLSETAFVKILDASNYELRWFTPTTEVDFCGHATLASSFVIFKDFTDTQTIQFHVKKLGIFTVEQAKLRQALTKPFKQVYLNAQAYIVEYETIQDVLDERPDFELLKQLGHIGTARNALDDDVCVDVAIISNSQQYDCVSRYFAPANGISEDPVTGSIHTGIVPIWADKLGKNELVAYQASARSGELYCRILDNERIEISGYAKLYMQAEISVGV